MALEKAVLAEAAVLVELDLKIYKELGKAGITIPFPQRDVWMRGQQN